MTSACGSNVTCHEKLLEAGSAASQAPGVWLPGPTAVCIPDWYWHGGCHCLPASQSLHALGKATKYTISLIAVRRRPAYVNDSFHYVTKGAESEQPVGAPLYQWVGCRDHAGIVCFPHSGSWQVQCGPAYMCRYMEEFSSPFSFCLS